MHYLSTLLNTLQMYEVGHTATSTALNLTEMAIGDRHLGTLVYPESS